MGGFSIWEEAFRKILPPRTSIDHSQPRSRLGSAAVRCRCGGGSGRLGHQGHDGCGSKTLDSGRSWAPDSITSILPTPPRVSLSPTVPAARVRWLWPECAVMHMLMLVRRPRRSEELMRKGRMWETVRRGALWKAPSDCRLRRQWESSGRQGSCLRGCRFTLSTLSPSQPGMAKGGCFPLPVTSTNSTIQLRTADFVSLHVPLCSETRHLLDGRRIALMHPARPDCQHGAGSAGG